MHEDLSVLTRTGSAPDLTMRYGDETDQVAEVRYGQRGEDLPLLVLIHGGFWKPEYDRAHTEAMSSALAEAGWTTLSLEYRRISGEPDVTLDDITSALKTLPTQVERHNGQVVFIGHSAGGHLALWAAARCVCKQLQMVLALAPAADLELAHALNLGDGAVQRFLGQAPLNRPDVNPMLMPAPTVAVTIVQGEDDLIVPPSVSVSYCAAFPNTRLLRLPNSGHFALIDPASNAWETIVNELNQITRGHDDAVPTLRIKH